MARSDLIDLTVIYQTRTEKAVCVREVEDGPDMWFPLSAVEIEGVDGGDLRRGEPAVLTGPEKLLTEKGLL